MLYIPTVISILEVLIITLPALFVVAFVTVAERKTMASMQRRVGPNIVGYYGLLQASANTLKLFLNELHYTICIQTYLNWDIIHRYINIIIYIFMFIYMNMSSNDSYPLSEKIEDKPLNTLDNMPNKIPIVGSNNSGIKLDAKLNTTGYFSSYVASVFMFNSPHEVEYELNNENYTLPTKQVTARVSNITASILGNVVKVQDSEGKILFISEEILCVEVYPKIIKISQLHGDCKTIFNHALGLNPKW